MKKASEGGVTKELAFVLIWLAQDIDKNALKGRTVDGVAFELIAHYVGYKYIPVGKESTKITDIGSVGKNNIGYDYNASVFENNSGKFSKVQNYVKQKKWIRATAIVLPILIKVRLAKK